MMGYNDGYGMVGFGPFIMVLFLGLFVMCTIWLIGTIFPAIQKQPYMGSDGSVSAQELLKLRFAKGELTADDYSKMSKLIHL